MRAIRAERPEPEKDDHAMLHYPKIPSSRKCPQSRCVAFEKYDGTSLHWDWDRGFGWHSFGTRRNEFNLTDTGIARFALALVVRWPLVAMRFDEIAYHFGPIRSGKSSGDCDAEKIVKDHKIWSCDEIES